MVQNYSCQEGAKVITIIVPLCKNNDRIDVSQNYKDRFFCIKSKYYAISQWTKFMIIISNGKTCPQRTKGKVVIPE